MTRLLITSLLVFLIGGLATAAHARPRAQPRARALKRFEVRLAPFVILYSWASVEAAYRVNPNVSTGPAAIAYNAGGTGKKSIPTYKGYAAGWQVVYYFDQVERPGWYSSGHIYYEDYKNYTHDNPDYFHSQGMRLDANVGYQFKFRHNFNLLTGLGAEFLVHQNLEVGPNAPHDGNEYSTDEKFNVNAELKLGYEF
jgi:hypothetical protein